MHRCRPDKKSISKLQERGIAGKRHALTGQDSYCCKISVRSRMSPVHAQAHMRASAHAQHTMQKAGGKRTHMAPYEKAATFLQV